MSVVQHAPKPLRVGISACLLGQEVRFDGGHKRDAFLTDVLGRIVEWVPVCPEVEMGLGTPREPVRLVREAGALRMVTTNTEIDHTDRMVGWAAGRLDELAGDEPDLCGYVLKKDSPSCGMEGVKTFDPAGTMERNGRGLFAAALMARLPALPIEDEGRLGDVSLRENFVERLFAYQRLQNLFRGAWSLGTLIAFHTAHKMTLLSHSRTRYDELGRLVAEAKALPKDELRSRYEMAFMSALAIPATRQTHTDVLMHMSGHLKDLLDPAPRQELLASIEAFRQGRVELSAPLDLLRRHVKEHGMEYLAGQVFLERDPRAAGLRGL